MGSDIGGCLSWLHGSDLAKNVFQLFAVDKRGNPCFSHRVNCQKLKETVQNMPLYKVVMEACGCANYWGRMYIKVGHKAQLLPAQHVTPFVRGNIHNRGDTMHQGLGCQVSSARTRVIEPVWVL